MTTILTRQPLQTLPMSTSNRAPRRSSGRLQEKQDAAALSLTNGYHATQQHGRTPSTRTAASRRGGDSSAAVAKKRKIEYDEEDEGFMFTRAKARKSKTVKADAAAAPEPAAVPAASNPKSKIDSSKAELKGETTDDGSKRNVRRRISFPTPQAQESKPVRRSRRISSEDQQETSPKRKKRKDDGEETAVKKSAEPVVDTVVGGKQQIPDPEPNTSTEHAATKIAIPFADTPIIRRNKAMREGRGSKGERRSSLGMRGRRASSLIDSGTSNALPHQEVDMRDFYKHIESQGLSEPRRMRQLLTWCATRAMEKISTGKEFEDQSARLAARVVEEELLKDLSDRSEMSDWFSREDAPAPAIPVVIKPNPKNIQNTTKIQELEEQIKRLQVEKKSLEALLRPPEIPKMTASESSEIDTSLLSPSDLALHQSLTADPPAATTLSSRLNSIISSLGPKIDAFADGVHRIGQYRDSAERVATKSLSICAETLEARDRESLRKATGDETKAKKVGRESIGGVLRGLSRLES